MVRHHVAQRAGGVVIIAAAADGQRFGDRDLHVIDMVAIPDRLEQAIGEAQHQDVLHGLLAEIMIDAKNLILFEDAEQLLIERLRRGEIGAERLFDDDAPPGAVVFARQTGLAEMACRSARSRPAASPDRTGGCPWCCARASMRASSLADFFVGLRIVGLALHIGDAGEKLFRPRLHRSCGWRISAGFSPGRRETPRSTIRSARRRSGRRPPAAGRDFEIVQRRNQQPVREVARRAENHQAAWIGRPRRRRCSPS